MVADDGIEDETSDLRSEGQDALTREDTVPDQRTQRTASKAKRGDRHVGTKSAGEGEPKDEGHQEFRRGL